ncbi:MAG: AraC family transcriptional regulator [Defluviitaleaceae bacterium]|nr:AraC family transcriptional regulator [Defluviitaleaceae bacterium]
MHAWEAIQKTLEIIETRIGDDIEIEELSASAALSPFYYQRLFSRLVKKPVREYIKLRRLARACEALRGTKNRILDVALAHGFGSHEVFTRTFKDAYGMTPTEYRECEIRLNNFLKPNLLLNYQMVDLGVPLVSDGLVLEINREKINEPVTFVGVKRFVSITGQFPNGETTGISEPGEIWRLFGEAEGGLPTKAEGRKIGVAYHDTAPEGCFPYFAGAEANPDDSYENLQTWTLPAAEYIVCKFEAENSDELVSVAMNKAFNYIRMWQDKKGLKHGDFGAEIYFNNKGNPNDENINDAYMEIWALWLAC